MKPQANNNDGSSIASIHDLIVSKEPGLEKKLAYDWYRRTALVDHFLTPDTNLDQLANGEYVEQGDFVQSPYQYETERLKNCLNIRLYRNGVLNSNGQLHKIAVTKNIQIDPKSSALKIQYELKNLEKSAIGLWFAPEFNFALLAGEAPDRYYYFDTELNESRHLASSGIVQSVQQMGLRDDWLKIDIQMRFSKKTTIWRFPVETISKSEGGFERIYQSSVVVPNWKIQLEPEAEWSVEINKKIIDL